MTQEAKCPHRDKIYKPIYQGSNTYTWRCPKCKERGVCSTDQEFISSFAEIKAMSEHKAKNEPDNNTTTNEEGGD